MPKNGWEGDTKMEETKEMAKSSSMVAHVVMWLKGWWMEHQKMGWKTEGISSSKLLACMKYFGYHFVWF